MHRLIVLSISLVLLALLLPVRAEPGKDDVQQLAEKLLAVPVKGPAAKRLVLNKSVGSAAPSSAANTQLARAVGFLDSSTAPYQSILTSKAGDDQAFAAQLDQWQKQGVLKTARAVEEPKLITALDTALAEARKKHGQDDAAFVAFLKKMKVAPQDARVASIDEAKLPRGDERGPLYYFAQRFYLNHALASLKQRAELVRKHNPDALYGGSYDGSMESQRNWDAMVLEAWRTQAFTAPWIADRSWQNGDFSPQVAGYYLSLARSAGFPDSIFCDVHVGAGSYPAATRRSFYQALGQGARGIRFVGADPSPQPGETEFLSPDQFNHWKTLRELTHEAGQNESFLLQSRTREPDVGIVVSLASEIWNPELWVHEERKAIYHAARLGGHNVALLTEEDVQEGRYRNFTALFLVGSHLQRETTHVLNRWAKNGGSVCLVGGPWRDEFDQPLTNLYALMGISNPVWETLQSAGPAKIQLPKLPSLGKMNWNYEGLKREFPVVLGKLKFSIDPAHQDDINRYGSFDDGTPAIIRHVLPNTNGKGHVWTYATPVGSAWFKTVLPQRAWERGAQPSSYNHRLLVRELDGEMGDVVTAATGEARWDVITDNLAVETILLTSPKQVALVCINWSHQPQKALLTAQFIPKNLLKAVSLNEGALKTQRIGVTLTFKVNVPVTDLVLLEP